MPNLISRSTINLLMNMKYGIVRRHYLEVNEMVFPFKRTIKNILSSFIPHEIIICIDRHLPWINNRVKGLINEKKNTF